MGVAAGNLIEPFVNKEFHMKKGFALETNKQKNKAAEGRHEIMDYVNCSVDAHAQIPIILCQNAPARTVWNKTKL